MGPHLEYVGLREPFNTLTHMAGALAAVAGLVYLVVQAEGALAVTAFALYGGALVALYLTSALYHALPAPKRRLRLLRRLDHSAIYVFIAATYTPVCLVSFSPGWGWSIFSVVWGLAITGIVIRNVAWRMPRWAYTALYLGMGWVAVVAIKPLVDAFSWTALAWLLAGGLAYTLGAVVYATEWPDLLPRYVGHHGIWHLFVLAGSAFHYVFIAGYVA